MMQSALIALPSDPGVIAQIPIDPNALIDPTNIGWQEGVAAAVVMVVSLLLASVARRFMRRTTRSWPNAQTPIVRLLTRLTGWIIVLLGATLALFLLGFEIGPIVLIVGVGAAVLVVMGRPLLENIGASVVLQTEAPFRVGDLVEVLGATGVVREISNRTTLIDTFDGKRLHVPNNQVLNSSIVNLSKRGGRRSEIRVGVEYGTDLDRARAVILKTVGQIDAVYDEPAPEALVNEFGDSAVIFLVWFWYEPLIDGAYRVTDQVARAVDRALRREGIVIAFPQRVVWTRDSTAGDDADESGA